MFPNKHNTGKLNRNITNNTRIIGEIKQTIEELKERIERIEELIKS